MSLIKSSPKKSADKEGHANEFFYIKVFIFYNYNSFKQSNIVEHEIQ